MSNEHPLGWRYASEASVEDVFAKDGLCEGCGKVGKLAMVAMKPMWDHDTEDPDFSGPMQITDRGYCRECAIVFSDTLKANDMSVPWSKLSPEQQRQRMASLGLCPRCEKQANAFNHVSVPPGPADGAYAMCPECRVYWPLSTEWVEPETMDPEKSREVTRLVCDACELVDPPAAVISLAREQGFKVPRLG